MPTQINTINQSYEGNYVPSTKVKFNRRLVNDATGNKVEGVFADFTAYNLFTVRLPQSHWSKTDKEQFNYCLNELRTAFQANQNSLEKKLLADHHLLIDNCINTFHGAVLDSNQILEKQVSDILNTKSIQQGRFYGYTWHHTEHAGEMQLIPDFIHNLVKHTGGREIWGGGRLSRQ
jgi:hypothetical protein